MHPDVKLALTSANVTWADNIPARRSLSPGNAQYPDPTGASARERNLKLVVKHLNGLGYLSNEEKW